MHICVEKRAENIFSWKTVAKLNWNNSLICTLTLCKKTAPNLCSTIIFNAALAADTSHPIEFPGIKEADGGSNCDNIIHLKLLCSILNNDDATY